MSSHRQSQPTARPTALGKSFGLRIFPPLKQSSPGLFRSALSQMRSNHAADPLGESLASDTRATFRPTCDAHNLLCRVNTACFKGITSRPRTSFSWRLRLTQLLTKSHAQRRLVHPHRAAQRPSTRAKTRSGSSCLPQAAKTITNSHRRLPSDKHKCHSGHSGLFSSHLG